MLAFAGESFECIADCNLQQLGLDVLYLSENVTKMHRISANVTRTCDFTPSAICFTAAAGIVREEWTAT